VQVLVAGQVAAHHDQVQVLVVGRRVRGDRVAVRAGDPEREVGPGPDVQSGGDRREAVAVLGHLEPAGNLHGAGGLARVVVARVVVARVVLAGVVRRGRRLAVRADRVADAEGGREDRRQPGREAAHLDRRLHVRL
jgi:hypothetical protein